MRFYEMIIGPAVLCAVSVVGALAMVFALGLNGSQIFGSLFSYTEASMRMSFIGLLVWAIIPWLRPIERRHLGPIDAIVITVRDRGLLLLVPTLVFPIFMTSFTVMKISLPLVTGYHWDGVWTNLDAFIFGTDPW